MNREPWRNRTASLAFTLLLASLLGCSHHLAQPNAGDDPDMAAGAPDLAQRGFGTIPPGSDMGGGGEFPPTPDVNGLPCPPDKQYLLILDFRSGWWIGGGGVNFNAVIMPFLAATCGGIKLEYHHYEAAQPGMPPTPATEWHCLYDGNQGSCGTGGFTDILSSIVEKDWTAFTQFWILSGDKEDPSDIGDGDMIYKLAVQQTADACTPFLLGVGDGFITHGNVAANAIGLGGDVFGKDNPAGFFEYFGFGLAVNSHVTVGKELTNHELFTDADTIADKMAMSLPPHLAQGDKLLANPLVTVIGKDTLGRPQIGYGRIPIANTPGRPFVLEAGMQRYYSIGVNDTKTGIFLRNIIKYLGSIGCKSSEPGWPS